MVHAADNSAPATLPQPVVKIDNSTDPFATVVKVEFGDRLGDLLDTVRPVFPTFTAFTDAGMAYFIGAMCASWQRRYADSRAEEYGVQY